MKDLPAALRPREKLLTHGPAALADAELLALLLRTGIAGKHVMQLAQELLERFGGIGGLLQADAGALGCIKGLVPAKRAELQRSLVRSHAAGIGIGIHDDFVGRGIGTALIGSVVIFSGAYLMEKTQGQRLLNQALRLLSFLYVLRRAAICQITSRPSCSGRFSTPV